MVKKGICPKSLSEDNNLSLKIFFFSAWGFTNKKGKTKKCGWVANKPDKRCRKVGDDGRKAEEACQAACNELCDP